MDYPLIRWLQSPPDATRQLYYHRNWSDRSIPKAADAGISGIQVIVFDQPQANPAQVSRLCYFGLAHDTSTAPPASQPETNPHFLGRFTDPSFTVTMWPTGSMLPPPAQVEVSQSFLARFTQPQFRAFIPNSAAFDFSSSAAAVETNPNFLAAFTPVALARMSYNAQALDVPPVAEANPHFIARYWLPM